MKIRSLIPPPGNAMRPVFLLVAGFFSLMLIGYPIFMYVLGLGTAGIVSITLLILGVAAGILAFMRHLAKAYEQDESGLAAGDLLAEWTIPEHAYRRFVANERRSTNRFALTCASSGIVLGFGLGWLTDDWLLGGVMLVAFLFAALVTYYLGGPPRSSRSDTARQVRIGPRGVHVMGRYMPFEGTLMRLLSVQVTPGDPAIMRFLVQAGRRTDEIRVPVAPNSINQAEALVERFDRLLDSRQ